MSLAHVLEPVPLLVAMAIGAVGLYLLKGRSCTCDLWKGAIIGAAVQVGVRATGVS